MSIFLNEYDLQTLDNLFGENASNPNNARAVRTIVNLARWTDDNSDGWAYWAKPRNASAKLAQRLYDLQMEYLKGDDVADITDAELAKLLSPIKAFLTRQNVAHGDVIPEVIPTSTREAFDAGEAFVAEHFQIVHVTIPNVDPVDTLDRVLKDYDAWAEGRVKLCEREEEIDHPSSSEWEASDDRGVDILHRLATAARQADAS